MKLNERMRYPHPVLSEYSSDYISGEFRCEFEQNRTAANELRIAAELNVVGQVLCDALSNQTAAIGYYVVCRRTYFSRLVEVSTGRSEKFIDATRLYGTVVIRPVIWTQEHIANFKSVLFDKEFGESAEVAKGSVIALGPEFRFSVDRKKYKPFDSIFELAEDGAVKPGTIEVDPDQERITISAEPATYKAIAHMRGVPPARPILLSSVYLPAIMDVLARMQGGDPGLQGRKWYRVFRAKCDDIGVKPEDPGSSPLEIAQTLLHEPLKKTIATVERLS